MIGRPYCRPNCGVNVAVAMASMPCYTCVAPDAG